MGLSDKWADLAPRLGSAVVLLALGGAAILAGGLWIRLLMTLAAALMIWELVRLTHPPGRGDRWALMGGGAMVLIMAAALLLDWRWALLLPLALQAMLGGRAAGTAVQLAAPAYAAAIGLTGYVLVTMRDQEGLAAILWLVGVVVISDIAGYVAGRALGGPKFWPRISPKKTWSGTVAGWIGAAAFGAVFALMGHTGWVIVLASVVVSFAGQMGDIAESALKRRAGVKDSSNLIPGHGGFLDRFDAIIAASLAVFVLGALGLMPGFGG